jgi:adenosylcobinamide-GDP ribazoletransferase
MLKSFLLAVQFLTRIPVHIPGKVDEADMPLSAVYYPLAGFVIGGVLVAFFLFFGLIFPAGLAAALTLGVYVLLTGALHLDGFVDTVDGLASGGGRGKKEDILKVMNDSRIGAIGAVWLAFLMALKLFLFVRFSADLLPVLVLLPVISRAGIVLEMHMAPAAKKNSLASALCGKISLLQALIALLSALVIAALFGPKPVLFLIISCLAAGALAKAFEKKLGGLTGDTIGFTVEVLEMLFLVLWSIKI